MLLALIYMLRADGKSSRVFADIVHGSSILIVPYGHLLLQILDECHSNLCALVTPQHVRHEARLDLHLDLEIGLARHAT